MNQMNQMNIEEGEEINQEEINLEEEEIENQFIQQAIRDTRKMTPGPAPLANNIWERSQLLSFLKFCQDAGKLTFSMPPANKNKKFLGIKRLPEYKKGYTSAGKVQREEKEALKYLKKIKDPREALPWRDEPIELWNNDLPYLKRQFIKCRWAQNVGFLIFPPETSQKEPIEPGDMRQKT